MRILMTACLTLGLVSAPAPAGPGEDFAEFATSLRSQAESRARRAAANPAAPPTRLDIEDPFFFELEQFSVDALRLSRAIDQAGGPVDLRCIFRGMSSDAAARLDALNGADSRGDQARVYRAIADLMRDAAEIAPAVDNEADLPDGITPPAYCPASRS